MSKRKVKSLVGWIWKGELDKVLIKQDGAIAINKLCCPLTRKTMFMKSKICACLGKHKPIKVRITIEQLPPSQRENTSPKGKKG